MLVDVHVRSHFSPDVEVAPEAILARAAEVGLGGVAFVDRGTTRNAAKLRELGEAAGVEVFVGLEVSTDHGVLLGFAPTIDGFYLDEAWREELDSEGTLPAWKVTRLFESIGGAVVAAHPYHNRMPWAMGDRVFDLEGLTALEVHVPWLPFAQNAFAVEAAKALSKPGVGGTAFRGDLEEIGTSATLFQETLEGQEAFVKALRAGECWAVAIGVDVEQDAPAPPPPERGSRDRDRDRGDRGRGGRSGGGRGRGERGERGGRSSGGRGGRGERGERGGRSGGGRGRDGGGRSSDRSSDRGKGRSGGRSSGGGGGRGRKGGGGRSGGSRSRSR